MRAGVATAEPQDAIVHLRRDDGTVETHDWTDPRIDLTTPLAPWRIPRWVHGQRHYSGRYWCATTTKHLLYESRLELARAIYADFDRTVNCIVAQPFQLEAKVDGKTRRYTPDYLLLTSKDPVVVEVKPRNWLTRPKVIRRTTLARQLVEQRGLQYEVWSEPPPVEFANLTFLAVLFALPEAHSEGFGPAHRMRAQLRRRYLEFTESVAAHSRVVVAVDHPFRLIESVAAIRADGQLRADTPHELALGCLRLAGRLNGLSAVTEQASALLRSMNATSVPELR